MKSILLCEGRTDAGILKYYMEKVNGWQDKGQGEFTIDDLFSREYTKNEDTLVIAAIGGCSNINRSLSEVMQYNRNQFLTENTFAKVAVVTDHDDEDTAEEVLRGIEGLFDEFRCEKEKNICNNQWTKISYKSNPGKMMQLSLLPLILPFDETGAIESFLLNAIADEDSYDKVIIDKGNSFVDQIDPEKRYLNHRRIMLKAKYEVFFSIRATAEKHNDRHNVMKKIPWETFMDVQRDFIRLGEL